MAAAPKLPASIKVGHRKIRLKITPAEDMDGLDGQYSQSNALIRIREDLVPHDLAETVIHEIFHACWPTTPLAGDVEEFVVTTLGEHWSQVIMDNPQLVSWLSHVLA